MTIELVQFRYSPYNEKVRWALDLKQVPHVRRTVLPGPHFAAVRRLTGRTRTPVLVHEGQALDQSSDILAWLDAQYPVPALLPTDPALREQALRMQAWFDDDITPRIRCAVLDVLLRDPRDFARIFGAGLPAWKQRLYALVVPLAAPVVRRGNGITGVASVQDGRRAIGEAMDFVAEHTAGSEFLVGDSLSVADVTAASTLATIVGPPDSPMSFPAVMGHRHRALVEPYAGHPAAAWVRRMYARHRASVADFDGPSP